MKFALRSTYVIRLYRRNTTCSS